MGTDLQKTERYLANRHSPKTLLEGKNCALDNSTFLDNNGVTYIIVAAMRSHSRFPTSQICSILALSRLLHLNMIIISSPTGPRN